MKRLIGILLLTITLTSCMNEKKQDENISIPENSPENSKFKKIETNNSLELQFQILNERNEEIEFSKLEKLAEYPGGFDSLEVFIQRNFEFPKSTENIDIIGRVESTFIIDTLGKVTDVEIVKSLRKEIDKACVDVISKMPEWKPTEFRNGKKAETKFLLPLKFVKGE